MMHEYSDHDTSDMPSWCSPEGQHVETTLRNMAEHEILLFDNSSFTSSGIHYSSMLISSVRIPLQKLTKEKQELFGSSIQPERERLEHCRTGLKITKMHFISCIHGNLSNTAHYKKS